MQLNDVANQTQNEDLTEVFNLLVETLKDEETNLDQFIIRHKGQKLNPCCDPIFKAMFTDNSPEANKALKSFLSAVLNREVDEVIVEPNEKPIESLSDKESLFDVCCRFKGEQTFFDVELQGRNTQSAYDKRAEYYTAHLLNHYTTKGMKWNEVPKVYQISVLNFFYTRNDRIINWYTMKNDDNQGLSGSMNVIFIEIKKIIKKLQNKKITRELINNLTVIEKWCIFFLCKRDEKFAMLSELIVKSQEGIMEAERVLSRIDEEEINWHRQNAYYDRLSHEATIIYEANEKGMKQGLQQGIQ